MRNLIGLVVVALATVGCANHEVHVRGNANARVTTEIPPSNNNGPVQAMAVAADSGGELPHIAVIDVDGLLLNQDFTGFASMGENPVSLLRERLDAAAADPCVRAVVVRINSPGGGVTASDIMWHDINTFKARRQVPVVACLLDYGTGGAYYMATAADQIVAHRTSVIGGIGVILNLYNLAELANQFNIQAVPIKAGVNINMGTLMPELLPMNPDPNQPQTDESLVQARRQRVAQRDMLRAMALEYHQQFQTVVRQQRPAVAPDPSTFDGRIFTATQALDRKLIDQIGYLDDAIELGKRLAHVEQARVVLYHRCNDPARTPYSVTPNVPIHTTLFPVSVPGPDRSRLPTFLYLWEPDPTIEKLGGR